MEAIRNDGTLRVRSMDHGEAIEVNPTDVRPLSQEFQALPLQVLHLQHKCFFVCLYIKT